MKTFNKIVNSLPDTFKSNLFIMTRAILEREIELNEVRNEYL